VPIRAGWDWQKDPALQAAKTRAIEGLGSRGRLLIRASGTEPVVRVMVEADTAELAQTTAQAVAAALTPAVVAV
jgi:phosphoglucosamine mutase